MRTLAVHPVNTMYARYLAENLKVLLNDLWFSKMFLDILTMYGPISKFRNRDFRSKDFILGRLRNMRSHTTALVEKLNPRVRVNNKKLIFMSKLEKQVVMGVQLNSTSTMRSSLLVFSPSLALYKSSSPAAGWATSTIPPKASLSLPAPLRRMVISSVFTRLVGVR